MCERCVCVYLKEGERGIERSRKTKCMRDKRGRCFGLNTLGLIPSSKIFEEIRERDRQTDRE